MSGDGGSGGERVVVVGAGQAGFQVAASLREGGFAGSVTLIGEEDMLPYGRPPLTKAFLKGGDGIEALLFRPAAYFAKHRIGVRTGARVSELDRGARRVRAGGEWVGYDRLVLATGARNRHLAVPGSGLAGVHSVRDAGDGLALRAALAEARRVVVVGGGFLGLEVAVSARGMGADVHVIEAGERLMARAVSPAVSDWLLARHRADGIAVRLGEAVLAVEGTGRVEGVTTTAGDRIAADLVVVAIGVEPNCELAEGAGLAVDGGVLVDERLRTSDPDILAAGDCARWPGALGLMRLESVQNAVDQGRCVAAGLLGAAAPYRAVPWFWSDQGARLQIAGMTAHADETAVRGEGDAFSVYCFHGGVLTGVESVNRPADHVKARRTLAAGPVSRAEF